jgi:hypothetical protein
LNYSFPYCENNEFIRVGEGSQSLKGKIGFWDNLREFLGT